MLMTPQVQQNLPTYVDELCERGPKYGYHPEAEQCILIVDANHEVEARQSSNILESKFSKDTVFLMVSLEINSTKTFVQKKIMEWANSIVILSCGRISTSSSFCCFSKICTI